FIITHRLRGAASLQGFDRVASQAEALEEALRAVRGAPADGRAAGTAAALGLLTALKTTLEEIEHAAEPVAAPATPPPPVAPQADPLRAELAAFFAANDDVLSYFGPEAAEHLEAMTTAIVTLERDGAGEASVAALFRAVHTLKGAAYVVGC